MDEFRSFLFDRKSIATFLFAGSLSIACLLRGAVYDIMVAGLLVAFLSLLFVMRSSPVDDEILQEKLHPIAHTHLFILLFPVLAVSQSLMIIFNEQASMLDITGLVASSGRMALMLVTVLLALEIAQSKKLSRLFLKTLLLTGLACVFITFMATASYHYSPDMRYAHGLVNMNHAATYLGIMLCLSIWKLQILLRRLKPTRRLSVVAWFDRLSLLITGRLVLLFFSVLLFTACIFLTQSRAGIPIAIACAMLLLFIIVVKKGARRQRPAVWLGVIFIFLCCLGGLFIIFDIFGSGLNYELTRHGVSFTTRPSVYAAAVSMMADFPLFGVGLGGFEHSFPSYRPESLSPEGIVEHGYNSFLEIGVEMGIPAFLAIVFVAVASGNCLFGNLLSRRKHYGFAAVGFAVWLLLMLHSLVDFPMQIPAIGAIGVAIITICCCQCKRQSSAMPRNNVRR